MKLVIATKNRGKLEEIGKILADWPFEIVSLAEFTDLPEVVEDGATFADNAEKKAATIARATGHLTLADDSGLVVEALGGAPGVHSARYAGPEASDADNNRKLLTALAEVPEPRRAAFVCDIALCTPAGDCWHFTGRLEGEILQTARGSGGFGYDPLFYMEDHGCTLAEMPLERKNAISHRGQALRVMLQALPDILSQLQPVS
ncbi:XTP/dITP diphosphohydrolase [Geothermobacter ehrlichii]|uniref:dITP/XTP pyrophosphatase n=1 Tax=Geothermobacter ehrlichii TaxID=213224 RepID=A0A5D3WJQ7_9BACT|nr:XTP/dITP diphosphatase [Geothermobacter ehrlichii]TYO98797.1 XTP/dITP diphosphohydrolase [Geothermobacter ehrlichii]